MRSNSLLVAGILLIASIFSIAIAQNKDQNPTKKQLNFTVEEYEKMRKQEEKERKKKSLPPGDPCISDEKCTIQDAPTRTVGGTRG